MFSLILTGFLAVTVIAKLKSGSEYQEDVQRLHSLISRCKLRLGKDQYLQDHKNFFIQLHDSIDDFQITSHIERIKSRFESLVLGDVYRTLVTGFTIYNASTAALDFVRSLPGVSHIGISRKYYAHSTATWGLDRIDQPNLPLDGSYKPDYDGSGVNVFIVDTGIDTTHREFQGESSKSRVVKNLFDINHKKGVIPDDNDGVGHGTHVAGTVGGITKGVSPGVNLYGIKSLDDQGSGELSYLLDGLSFVHDWYHKNKAPPTVISMSLGGPCLDYYDCANDPVVKAVEKLTASGITVVVAAGNDDCDACLNTPAFAASAITVGATDMNDKAAIFSDFGKCVDIYAPGQNINSSCAKSMCDNPGDYIELSGTSMACPHVTGVAAQILQIHPSAAPQLVTDMMSCIAQKGVLNIIQDTVPAVTRNLLLQVPIKSNRKDMFCDLGYGCPGQCSGYGLCQANACICDRQHWGKNCSVSVFGKHCDAGYKFVEYTLWDSDGESWQGTELRISQILPAQLEEVSAEPSERVMETILTTSMCGGSKETSGVCLVRGQSFNIEVSAGPNGGSDASWSMCGLRGGVPFSADFEVGADGSCKPLCRGHFIEIKMQSIYERGWGGGYYEIFSAKDGSSVAGGSINKKGSDTHLACLTEGIYAVIFAGEFSSSASRRSTWSICGVSRTLSHDYLIIEIGPGNSSTVSPDNACRVLSKYPSVSEPTKDFPDSCVDGAVLLGAFDKTLAGWGPYNYTFSSADSVTMDEVLGGGSVPPRTGAIQVQQCLFAPQTGLSVREWRTGTRVIHGKPSLSLANDSANSTAAVVPDAPITDDFLINESKPFSESETTRVLSLFKHDKPASNFWISCGKKGKSGESYRFKKDSESEAGCVQECQQMSTPIFDQPAPFQYILTQQTGIKKFLGLHSVEDNTSPVCVGNATNNNATMCYRMLAGGGQLSYDPVWNFCGQTFPSNAVVDFCTQDWVNCEGQVVETLSCNPDKGESGFYLLMIAAAGNGWAGAGFEISSGDRPTDVIATDTLKEGMTGYSGVCLEEGCYQIKVSNGKIEDELLWLFCGAVGQAGSKGYFQIIDQTCHFTESMISCRVFFLIRKYFVILLGVGIFLAIIFGVLLVICFICLCGIVIRLRKRRFGGFQRLDEMPPRMRVDHIDVGSRGDTDDIEVVEFAGAELSNSDPLFPADTHKDASISGSGAVLWDEDD